MGTVIDDRDFVINTNHQTTLIEFLDPVIIRVLFKHQGSIVWGHAPARFRPSNFFSLSSSLLPCGRYFAFT